MLLKYVNRPTAFPSLYRSIAIEPRRGAFFRTFCVVPDSSTPQQKESRPNQPSLKEVTFIKTARDAAYAIKALLELPKDRHVAWSVQSPPNSQSVKLPCTISAYGGNDINFGSGPHLLIHAPNNEASSRKVWELFKTYFEDAQARKIWHSCSSVWPVLSQSGACPAGFSGDLKTMASLTAKDLKDNTLHGLASTYLSQAELHKCTRIFKNNEIRDSEGLMYPWQNVSKDARIPVDHIWVAAACADASLVFSLFQKLQKVLQGIRILNRHSFSQERGGFNDMLQLYDEFFVPLVRQLSNMQQQAVSLNMEALVAIGKAKKNEWERHREAFLNWATTFSPDSKQMSLDSPDQLRQLLFAPCKNKSDRTEELPAWRNYEISKGLRTKAKDNARNQRKTDAFFTLRGYGATPVDYTRNGWPSTSTTALRKAAQWPRKEAKGFERNSETFCKAVGDLLKAKAIRAEWSLKGAELAKLVDSNVDMRMPYEVSRAPGFLRLEDGQQVIGDFANMALRARQGNVLLVGQFLHLELEILHLLSGCESLRLRLERDVDVHEVLAVSLFDDVWEAFTRGLCIYKSDQNPSSSGETIKDKFPEQCERARKLDTCMIRGGNPMILGKSLKLSSKDAQKLANRWRELHPGVQEWQTKTTAMARSDGFVESILGRRMEVRKKRVRGRTKIDEWDVLSKVMNGSAGDVVMDTVMAAGEQETLRALGWQVVFVDGRTIVLEGPEYAVETVRCILENDLGLLKIIHSDVEFPVRKMELRSVTELCEAFGAGNGLRSKLHTTTIAEELGSVDEGRLM